VFLLSIVFSIVDRIDIDDINLKNYKVEKFCKHHNVYYSSTEYLKLWKDYSWHFKNGRNQVFKRMVEIGFFEGIAPLKAIIMRGNECIGYSTKVCRPVSPKAFQVRNIKQLKNCLILDNGYLVIQLFRNYKEKIRETGYCLSGDFMGSWNMGIFDNQCYFIDLDRVSILSEHLKIYPKRKDLFLFVYEEW